MPEDRKLTEFDSYSRNKIKTLDDLFNYETKLNNQLAALKAKLNDKAYAHEKDSIQKQIDDIYAAYTEMIHDIEEEADAAIERQTKRRLQNYQREYAEYSAILEKNTTLSPKQKNKQKKALREAQKIDDDLYNKSQARRGKTELAYAKQRQRADRDEILSTSKLVMGGVGTAKEQFAASMSKVAENVGKAVGKAFDDISKKINSTMDTFSKYQSTIDTRLQATDYTFSKLQGSLRGSIGASPYLKTEDLFNNLQSMVEAGIVTNLEQRVFLNTIKDKVAATFDAANSSLLRIIRLQQNDSTAVRLGMEAYLTRFLNTMVENTEYLTNTFDSVQEALLEASSIMSAQASTEFEYIVQKWLGTLVGRGMSESTATSLAGALGMLGSGNISGLSGNALNNLLVMASSRAGIDYADILTNGLGAYEANKIMAYLVKYMQEINSSGSNVVRSQYAQTFGLNISDLMAASGIGDINSIYSNFLSYEGMYEELEYQLGQVDSRTHISEKITNLFDNAVFGLASTLVSNPVTAALWKVTDMIQGVTGGINIPAISAMGSGVDLETTVENLMKLTLVGVGSLGMIGDVITGLSQSGSGFSRVLQSLNINAGSANFRGNTLGRGLESRGRGLTASLTSSLIANSSGEDMQEQTLNAAMDDSNKKLAEQQASQDNPTADLRNYFIDVFDIKFSNLLNMIAADKGYDNALSVVNDTIAINDDRSIVRTTYRVSTDDKVNLVEQIESNVAGIYQLLQNGIVVTVNSPASSGAGDLNSNTIG